MNYVAGLLFTPDGKNLALIRKNKPAWQAGKLNAIGGKMEDSDESPLTSMNREFTEEAGVSGITWIPFCEYNFRGGCVHFFKACGDIYACRTMESEPIELVSVESLNWNEVVPNLKWLIPMSLEGGVSAVVTDAF